MKLNRYFETVKHSFVFGLGNLANNLIGFILLPVFTTYLSPTEYGISSLLSSTSSLIHLIALMGLSTSIYKYFFAAKEIDEKKRVITSAMVFLVIEGVILLIIGYFSAQLISNLLFESKEFTKLIWLMFINLSNINLQMIPLALFRATKRSSRYALYSAFNFSIGLLLNILFIVVFKLGLLGLMLSQAVNSFIFMIVGLIISRDYFIRCYEIKIIKDMLSYGGSLIFTGLFSYLLVNADRFIIQRLLDSSDVGFYSLAYKIGIIINSFFVQPFQLIWLPSCFEIYGNEGAESYYQKMLTYYFLGVGWLTFVLSIFSREVLVIMSNESYQWVYFIIQFIAFAYLFYGMYMIVNIGFYLKNKISDIIWITGAAALVNIGLNFWLIPSKGIFGAAIATLISYFILFILALYFNNKLLHLKYEWLRLLKISLVAISLLLMAQIHIENIFLSILFKLLLTIFYWLILFAIGLFSEYELNTVKSQTFLIFNILKAKLKNKAER